MQKILFVCRGNVGRSQAAMEYFRALGGQADSAGTEAADPSKTLGELAKAGTMLAAMKEDGIDVYSNHARQLTPAMLDQYDLTINMAGADFTPDWFATHPRVEVWDIPEVKDLTLEENRVVRDHIKAHVQALFTRLQDSAAA